MRYVYAIAAMVVWCAFVGWCRKTGCDISNDISLLSISIITAGALAGGD